MALSKQVHDLLKAWLRGQGSAVKINLDAPAAMTFTAGTVDSSGDNAVIAAPAAGQRLVVSGFSVQNESTTATTIILKDSANRFRVLAALQGDGLRVDLAPGREWRLPAATALTINLSGANQCNYSIGYWTEGA